MKIFGKRAARQQALADLDTAIARSERAFPAGARIATPSGSVAHVQSATSPGAVCTDMKDWPGPWIAAPDEMPLHRRCDLAVRAAGSREAS